MSSNGGCPSDSNPCAQSYPIREYFLPLIVLVVCLVCLRMLLHASYYTWMRIRARRQMLSNLIESRLPEAQSLSTGAESSLPISTPPPPLEPRVCVLVPGEDRPTFVAVLAPLAPSRDFNTQIMSLKAPDAPKSRMTSCV